VVTPRSPGVASCDHVHDHPGCRHRCHLQRVGTDAAVDACPVLPRHGGSSTVAAANITSVAVTCKKRWSGCVRCQPFDTGPAPAGLGTLAAFTINPLTGALTTANGTVSAPAVSVAVSDEVPSGLALDPDGTTLYVADFGETAVTPPPYDATGANIAPWTFTTAGVLTEGTPVAMSTTTIQPASLAIDVRAAAEVLTSMLGITTMLSAITVTWRHSMPRRACSVLLS